MKYRLLLIGVLIGLLLLAACQSEGEPASGDEYPAPLIEDIPERVRRHEGAHRPVLVVLRTRVAHILAREHHCKNEQDCDRADIDCHLDHGEEARLDRVGGRRAHGAVLALHRDFAFRGRPQTDDLGDPAPDEGAGCRGRSTVAIFLS